MYLDFQLLVRSFVQIQSIVCALKHKASGYAVSGRSAYDHVLDLTVHPLTQGNSDQIQRFRGLGARTAPGYPQAFPPFSLTQAIEY
jgi:hypothetical protein